ncbi:unnamed protein product [Prunus armeniaca]
MASCFGSNGGEDLMVKRTIDESENKLIFLDPVIIFGFGDERWKRRIIVLSLGIENGQRRRLAATINKSKQATAAKNKNNLS